MRILRPEEEDGMKGAMTGPDGEEQSRKLNDELRRLCWRQNWLGGVRGEAGERSDVNISVKHCEPPKGKSNAMWKMEL